jgi:hypothetical protein
MLGSTPKLCIMVVAQIWLYLFRDCLVPAEEWVFTQPVSNYSSDAGRRREAMKTPRQNDPAYEK